MKDLTLSIYICQITEKNVLLMPYLAYFFRDRFIFNAAYLWDKYDALTLKSAKKLKCEVSISSVKIRGGI